MGRSLSLANHTVEEEEGVLLVKHRNGKYKYTAAMDGKWRWKGGGREARVMSGYHFLEFDSL